jgi:glycosyltransferase involved in cell wall biosynthesis
VSDIGLSPDPYNTLNNHSTMLKTMEYMALGLPVVAFDLLETRYSAQEAALYATPNVIEDFADHIEYLLEHEEVRQSMGAYGRQRIVEKLSWRQSSQHLLQAYAMLSGSIEKYTTPDASESSTIAQSIEQTAQENTI